MSKKFEKQKKTAKMELSGVRKPMSDLNRLRNFSDRKIQNALKRDPDAAPLLIDWPKDTKVILPKRKVAVSLRLDPEVLEFYKHQQAGHLSLMNAVLKAYMQNQQHNETHHR